jgi:hypothetical protein
MAFDKLKAKPQKLNGKTQAAGKTLKAEKATRLLSSFQRQS